MFCIAMDDEILELCEKIGFTVRTSRKYKFYLLFTNIGLFIFGIVLVQTKSDSWEEQQNWISNASDNNVTCAGNLYNKSAARLTY